MQVQRLDDLGLLSLMPLSSAGKPDGRPGPSPEKMASQMHLVCSDGRVWAGAEAVGKLATIFPRSRFLGRIILLPGIRQTARLVYGLVARHRLRLSKVTRPRGG